MMHQPFFLPQPAKTAVNAAAASTAAIPFTKFFFIMSPSFSQNKSANIRLARKQKTPHRDYPCRGAHTRYHSAFHSWKPNHSGNKKSHLRPMLKIGAKIPRYHPTLFLEVSYS